ncbi:MAG: SusC/RagA family TonB-linked outer membrane protein [Saprospiraceae bacterium]|nr:SusC/RagA family TonB-linked outer membrane protein [Saprospiraceae bacterium]
MKKNLTLPSRVTLIIALAFCIPVMLFSQKTVTGVITDAASGETLIGANVLVPNTSIGTITDIDGTFSLTVDENVAELEFSYTGYQSLRVTIPADNVMNISLSFGELLEEIIVIGYGEVRREDATGSIQSISAKEFNKGAIAGPQQLLSGKIAGVNITTDGSPGGGSAIRIRGESSLSASNDPLIVVDGIPLGGGVGGGRNPLNLINPNDIETMTVLKDASATAIYGNRASGGVIIITTKKGSVGAPLTISYNGNFSSGTDTKRIDVLSADEYRTAIVDLWGEGSDQANLLTDANTDWQDEVFRTSTGMDHNLNASGAFGDIPYRASVGYTNFNGLLKRDNFKRISTNINVTPRLIDNRLQLNLGIKSVRTNNFFGNFGAIGNALAYDPTKPVLDDSSPFGGYYTWTIPNGNPNALAPANPVALIEQVENKSTVNRYIFSASADYRFDFLKELRANLNLAYDNASGSGTYVVPDNASFAFDLETGGGANNNYTSDVSNSLLEFYLNYKKDFGVHTIDAMGGYSWQNFNFKNFSQNFSTSGIQNEGDDDDDNPREYYLVSFFGRMNYDYNDRILATFTLRTDGTSRFSPESRWGYFPAVGLAGKLIDRKSDYLDQVKVRAGWGITGQQDIGGDFYGWQGTYQLSTPTARYQFGNQFFDTYRPNGYDATRKWEETTTYNLGVDFSLVKDRLSGSIDVYQRNTKDLLNSIPIAAGTNLTNFLTTNIGNMENQGIEIALNIAPVSTEDIRWDINLNGAYNRAEITKLTSSDDPSFKGNLTGGIAGGVGSTVQIHSVGFAPRSFYVYEQIYDESGNILEGQFVDRNEDGIVNTDDLYRYENPAPDFTFGFTSTLNIKNFDFSFAGRASTGNFIYNNVQTNNGSLNATYNSSGYLRNVHSIGVEQNLLEDETIILSDAFIEDASFLRLDHITLGYTFPNLVKNGVRVYGTIQNPVVLTGYSGIDPEVFGGIDNTIYPRARTILFGLNVNF